MTYLGLRPGEKLYEELLVKTEELDKTPNSMIFIERDTPLCEHDINVKLEELKAACETEDDNVAREALRKAVPTWHRKLSFAHQKESTQRKGMLHKSSAKSAGFFYQSLVNPPFNWSKGL